MFRKLPENSPRICRKIIVHEFHQKYFPEFYNFPKFPENFETSLVNVPFQFCLAAESIGQDGVILPDDQPIKFEKAGQDEQPFNKQSHPIPPHGPKHFW